MTDTLRSALCSLTERVLLCVVGAGGSGGLAATRLSALFLSNVFVDIMLLEQQ